MDESLVANDAGPSDAVDAASVFKRIGLTGDTAAVYKMLQESGGATINQISKSLGISYWKASSVLTRKLHGFGLVSSEGKYNAIYHAVPLSQIDVSSLPKAGRKRTVKSKSYMRILEEEINELEKKKDELLNETKELKLFKEAELKSVLSTMTTKGRDRLGELGLFGKPLEAYSVMLLNVNPMSADRLCTAAGYDSVLEATKAADWLVENNFARNVGETYVAAPLTELLCGALDGKDAMIDKLYGTLEVLQRRKKEPKEPKPAALKPAARKPEAEKPAASKVEPKPLIMAEPAIEARPATALNGPARIEAPAHAQAEIKKPVEQPKPAIANFKPEPHKEKKEMAPRNPMDRIVAPRSQVVEYGPEFEDPKKAAVPPLAYNRFPVQQKDPGANVAQPKPQFASDASWENLGSPLFNAYADIFDNNPESRDHLVGRKLESLFNASEHVVKKLKETKADREENILIAENAVYVAAEELLKNYRTGKTVDLNSWMDVYVNKLEGLSKHLPEGTDLTEIVKKSYS
jgi:sugar-specific transcriptional regulator TrmB